MGDVRQHKGKLTWFKFILQGNLKRKSVQPCVSAELGCSHLCHTRSYLTEQFTKSQSVPSISWVMKTTIPTEVLRCSPFILSCFHTRTNAVFHRLPASQTEGGGGVPCFVPFHSRFFSVPPENGSFTSEKNLLRSDSPKKGLRFTSILPPLPGHTTPPPRDDLLDDNFKAFNGPVKEWMIIKQSSLCPLSASLFQSWVVVSEEEEV